MSQSSSSSSTLTTESVVDILTADESLLTQFAFEGFNPLIIRKEIEQVPGFKTDIPVLILLYIQRGTNINKIMQSMRDEGKARVNSLILKYNIKSNLEGNPRRTTFTLSRIAAAYPEVVCGTIFRKPEIFNSPIPRDFDDIPEFFKVPCFAALIPNINHYVCDALADCHLEMMVELDRIINSKNRPTPEDKLVQFQNAARTSKQLSNNQRLKYLQEFKVIVYDDKTNTFHLTATAEDYLERYMEAEDIDAKEDPSTSSGSRKRSIGSTYYEEGSKKRKDKKKK